MNPPARDWKHLFVLFLDLVDQKIFKHRFQRFCNWLADSNWWPDPGWTMESGYLPNDEEGRVKCNCDGNYGHDADCPDRDRVIRGDMGF